MQELSLKLSNYNKNQYKNFIENEPLDQLHSLKLYLDDLYYNTDQCVFSDIKYDTLKDILLKRDPKYIPPVGCKIRTHDNRIDLPFWLGSATKITPNEEKELDRWLSKNKCKDFIVTEKLDGVSGMFIQTNGKRYLYTRGDGLVGANISYLNMISGIVGAKTIREGLYDIKFIVYEIIGDKTMPSPLDQLEKLESLKFTTAMYEKVNNISIPKLEELHKKFKSKTKFEIDGIIIQSNVQYDRNITGNPSYLFAFKINSVDGIVETTVLDIEWNVSKWGQIIPVALIDPVELPGVTISRVTLSNAGLMMEKKIGPGAIVNVTRSKDVIPFIVDVVIACNDDELKFPDINYSWDENKVHLIINEDNIEPEILADMRIKLFASFFEKMGIKHVSHQTLKKIYEAGFDTLLKIIGMSKEELMTIDTFKDKSSTRIIDNIKNGLQEVNVCDLLGASSVLGYGMGRKKVKSLMTDIPDILSCNRKNLKERILKIEGFSEITTQKVIENLDYAIEFIDEVSKYVTYMKDSRVSNDLVGTKFVFSGFRSKEIETDIQNKGGSVSTSVSKKTTALIVSDKSDKNTSKFLKANECRVPIYTKEEFLVKYFK